MDDIAAWLEEIGLGQHAELLRVSDITAAVLPELTDEDLRELGLSLGHRRLLLKAIKDLAGAPDEPATFEASVVPSPSTLEGAAPRSEAERRQLTVMFVDLVGSTALSARLDPEDMRAVIAGYQNVCSEVIRRYEGHVAKFMGDGVLAYFGYPRAHEDDAERGIRAGLELAEAVARLSTDGGRPLAVRVGIATGQVVVGDLIGEGAAQEEAVVGETPNLAARLQNLAKPGGVVIGPGTQRLVAGLFDLTDLGTLELRGFGAKVQAWQVLGDSRAESRFQARSATGLTPFVGRQHELGMLLDRFEQAKESEGQVVLLSGEPGIGKSRLAHALIERLADTPHTRIRYYCSPYHVNSALHPIIEQLERAAAFEPDDSPERKLDQLEALLGQGTNDLAAVAPLFAALLSIPVGTRYPPLDLPAPRQRELTIAALLDQLAGLAARRPVVMVLEDGHWLDPTTTELFERMIGRVQTLPVLLLITFRPEFAPPWISYPHMTSLTLNRLGRRHSTEMIAAVAGGKPLPEAVLGQIWAKTEGVPLFVEELTKTVLESGLLEDRGDRFELTGPLPPLAIPATLQDSLMARLDRLAPVKEVAQIGAVIGREFSYRLLAALSPLEETALQEALSHLVGAELVFHRGMIPDAIYSFKHAFVQDAAYASLLKSRRQQLHAAVATALRGRFPEVADSQPEILAHHCTEAGRAEEAIGYWRRAGELATGRSANVEAIAHLSKGLELIRTLPDTPEHLAEELALRIAIGGPLTALRGYAAPEVEQTYSRSRALCEQLGRPAELFPVLRGLWNCHLLRGELQQAHDLSERLVALAEEQGAPLQRALARRALGPTLFYLGRFTDATVALDEGIAIDDAIAASDGRRADLLLHTESAGVSCRLLSGRALWFLGFPDRALERIEAGLALAQRLAHANSVAFALTWAAFLHNFRREFAAAQTRAEAAIAFANEHLLPQRLAQATMCRGSALVGLGRQTEGVAQLRTGLAAWNGTGAHLLDTQWLGFIAEAHLRAAEFDDALTALDGAAQTAMAAGDRHYQSELYRLKGAVLGATGEHDVAASWFQQAIDIARSQQAKSLELRAATSLARLWAEQGERQKAHDLLAPVYGWFTEGFDTADLKDAKALLDELR